MTRLFAALLLSVTIAACALPEDTPDMVRGTPIIFTGSDESPNGAWCWFQDERAIVNTEHPDGPMLVFTAISASKKQASESGDLDLHWLSLNSREQGMVELHDTLQQDDHNVAALYAFEDGRIMASYAKHGNDRLVRTRISGANDPTTWSAATTYSEEAGVTYNNLLTVGPDQTLLNFSRSRGWNPNFLLYDDEAQEWTYGGRLLASEGRPYMKYRNSLDGRRIHVVATDQHPRNYDNSIYHGVMNGVSLANSYGTIVDEVLSDQDAAEPSDLTVVFEGDADNVAWMADVEVDANDQPVIAFSVQKDGRGLEPRSGGLDHRYHLARFKEGAWEQHEIAYAGERLYRFEDDYTGLVAIDPHNANHVVISTNADPDTGEPLVSIADNKRHYELYEGVSDDDGATFSWTPLTRNSTVDNIRPVIPSWDSDQRIVLWMRGTYRSYTDWDTQIVGIVQDR